MEKDIPIKLVLKCMLQSERNIADSIWNTCLQLDKGVWGGESSKLLQFKAKMLCKHRSALPRYKRYAIYYIRFKILSRMKKK
jgi:hypothetical protein